MISSYDLQLPRVAPTPPSTLTNTECSNSLNNDPSFVGLKYIMCQPCKVLAYWQTMGSAAVGCTSAAQLTAGTNSGTVYRLICSSWFTDGWLLCLPQLHSALMANMWIFRSLAESNLLKNLLQVASFHLKQYLCTTNSYIGLCFSQLNTTRIESD